MASFEGYCYSPSNNYDKTNRLDESTQYEIIASLNHFVLIGLISVESWNILFYLKMLHSYKPRAWGIWTRMNIISQRPHIIVLIESTFGAHEFHQIMMIRKT